MQSESEGRQPKNDAPGSHRVREGEGMNGIAVLMYHAVEAQGDPAGAMEAGEQRYVLGVERFREQISYLHREGFRSLLFSELLTLDAWPEKAVVLTFDDGHVSNLTMVLPLLLSYGFKAEFFITTDWLGAPRQLTEEGVRALHAAGMGIGSHGCSHAFLDQLDTEGLERELRDSRDLLSGITGEKVVSLSAPGGRIGAGVAASARRLGYRVLFSSRPGLFRGADQAFCIPRLAVLGDTDLKGFRSMVHGDRPYLSRMTRRYQLLDLAKKMLGEKSYQALRKMMLEMS